MALAAGTGYLVNLIYYASIGTVKMVDLIPVPSLVELTSLMGGLFKFLVPRAGRPQFMIVRDPLRKSCPNSLNR